jgi:hypothetical protein
MANGAVGGGWGIRGDGTVYLKHASNNQATYNPGVGVDTLLMDTNWHHVVYVITTSTTNSAAQTVQLYIDGVLTSGSFSGGGFTYSTNTDLTFGKRNVGNNWGGSLDDVRIYSRGLTSAEILALSKEYRP